MRLIGSFQTITIQGTSGSATSSRSGARSRAGAVVLMLLMTSMVAKPRWERKAGRDRPPAQGGDRLVEDPRPQVQARGDRGQGPLPAQRGDQPSVGAKLGQVRLAQHRDP